MATMMKSNLAEPESFLPLTPAVFHIMLALTDGEQHGYAIMQSVQDATEGRMRMGPGTLYGTIKRMIADGLIEESAERPDPARDDERRRYYRLSGFGLKVAALEANRLETLVRSARRKNLLGLKGARA